LPGKVLEMLCFVGYFMIGWLMKGECSRMNIVKNLTNSDFVLVYKGFWKVWGGRIVGVGFLWSRD
jgi:hypothetical protein